MKYLSDKEYFIQQYLDLKKSLGRPPIVAEYFRVTGNIMYRLNAYFGQPGWRNMLRVVGDKPGQWTRKKLGKEHLINHYHKLKKKLRRQPTYREYYRATGHADTVIAKYFGKPAWRSMLAVMNDKPLDRLYLDVSIRQVILNDYMQLKEKIGRQPVCREFFSQKKHSMSMVKSVFGIPGWRNLLQAAGDAIVLRGRPSISCKHLLDHYNKLKSRLGKIPTYDEYTANARHYLPTMIKCFGVPGWKRLVAAAEHGNIPKITETNNDRSIRQTANT